MVAVLAHVTFLNIIALGIARANDSAVNKPNFVILFADNLGYADVSIFGSPTARTPNVDRLGFEGMKLNNWNSVAHLCSASRASLLTGKYPVRTGVYPGVFKPDSGYGLLPSEKTIAEYLKEIGYATSLVGKWHLGHGKLFLPTNQGFDEWLGLPYHASGGSVDNHICYFDQSETVWLPLYSGTEILQQPVQMEDLAKAYADRAVNFIRRNQDAPFLLYMAFSHVHQMCAPRDFPEQPNCQWSRHGINNSTFVDAVEEMDWITGQVLDVIDDLNLREKTLIIFTSDNGPWVAEQKCSGSKGPFEGRWLSENVAQNCTACPHDYVADPTSQRPRRCTLAGTSHSVDGVHCGQDTGLGSVWEANVRMPALARWTGRIPPRSESMELVSTLDVLPTVLSMTGIDYTPSAFDGVDISSILLGTRTDRGDNPDRVLFLWRDGFQKEGPLPAPYGRLDIAAVKVGRFKAWIWTKSAHYNPDQEMFHDPPLLFDVLTDPAEAFPLDPSQHVALVDRIKELVLEHKTSIDWTVPLTLFRDRRFIPCVDPRTGCRTNGGEVIDASKLQTE